ncbi:MAG: hypothetical protein JST24_08135 [Acidobacteria bacterium]|nr:hypothetical protein [Acidobacteriota bacterium]
MTDNIFRRLHSLQLPGENEVRPVLVEENPSRDFFFPLTAHEALQVLKEFSPDRVMDLTHIWLRRDHRSESSDSSSPLAEFICGSRVRVIILYPWRKDHLLSLGAQKPQQKVVRAYSKFGAEIFLSGGCWYARFPEERLRDFYIQHLLLHEFAHHLDWYNRRWSKANQKQTEEFANQYAVRWGSSAIEVLDRETEAK